MAALKYWDGTQWQTLLGVGGGVNVSAAGPSPRAGELLWVDTDDAPPAPAILQPFASVYNTTDIAVATATYTLQTWNTVDEDQRGFYSAGTPSRLTVPSGLGGLYEVNLSIWFTSNATGARYIRVIKNGAGAPGATAMRGGEVTQGSNFTGLACLTSLSFVARFVAGDYIEAGMYQNSGASLNSLGSSTNRFAMTRVSS